MTRIVLFILTRLVCSHYGTYASAINGFSPKTRKALAETRKQLYSELPKALSRAKVANLGTGIPKRPKRLAGLLTWDEEERVVLVVCWNSKVLHTGLTYPLAECDLGRISSEACAKFDLR